MSAIKVARHVKIHLVFVYLAVLTNSFMVLFASQCPIQMIIDMNQMTTIFV